MTIHALNTTTPTARYRTMHISSRHMAHAKQSASLTFTMCKAVYAVIWCSALGEVCHTSITYENEAIYVSYQFLLLLFLFY